jgi:hypothetical protein
VQRVRVVLCEHRHLLRADRRRPAAPFHARLPAVRGTDG